MGLAQASAGFEAVDPRQHHVEQDQVGLVVRINRQGFFAGIRGGERVTFLPQDSLQDADVHQIIVHHQNLQTVDGLRNGDLAGFQCRLSPSLAGGFTAPSPA